MAKGIKRAVRDSPEMRLVRLQFSRWIGSTRCLVGVVIGLLSRSSWEACWEPAGRAVLPEEDVGNRIASFSPEEPGCQYRLSIGNSAFQCECTTVLQHNDDRLPDPGHSFG